VFAAKSAASINDETVGIDMELQRNKIIRIADKFIDEEFQYLEPVLRNTLKLTVIWGAKEAILKLETKRELVSKTIFA
jgi:phosphopantetheinyl transferase